MERAYDRRHLRHRRLALQCGAFTAVLVAATVLAANAGGLLERLLTGKESQRTEAPGSPGSGALATARLTIEGMV
jgi:hypothetical protein